MFVELRDHFFYVFSSHRSSLSEFNNFPRSSLENQINFFSSYNKLNIFAKNSFLDTLLFKFYRNFVQCFGVVLHSESIILAYNNQGLVHGFVED